MKFSPAPLDILNAPAVKAALNQAWRDSQPGLSGGHEEGGFVVLDKHFRLAARRWPKGDGNVIRVPEHVGCVVDGLPIVATFHTHPNTEPDHMQEPGETDKRGVREDAELKGSLYVGEFVVANELIYLVTPDGTVRDMGSRAELLG